MKESIIEMRKQTSQVLRKIENKSKTDRCLLCNRELKSHCNSHIVPQFILKEIAEDGKISYGATFFTPLIVFVMSIPCDIYVTENVAFDQPAYN